MDKKTKNIIVSIIIVILIVCLAFTIKGNTPNKVGLGNFDRPTVNQRSGRRNNRFNWEDKDNKVDDEKILEDAKTDEKEDSAKKEDSKEIGDSTSNNRCRCQQFNMPQMNNGNMSFNNYGMQNVESDDNTLKIALVTIESFLLGGSVMYLILNNMNRETEEKEVSKTRRVK